jgi:hypothetical protein
LNLPADRWDFNEFYSETPDDTDRFLCKVLAAGAVAIYLDIITKSDIKPINCKTDKDDSADRVVHIFNSFLNICSDDNGKNPVEFDPFQCDLVLEGITIDDNLRKAYADRVSKLFAAFKDKFRVCDCVDILGFDPFSYEDYDEEIQEEIESGEWMQKCVECMQYIITTIRDT